MKREAGAAKAGLVGAGEEGESWLSEDGERFRRDFGEGGQDEGTAQDLGVGDGEIGGGELEVAIDKFSEAKELADSIEHDLVEVKNKITVASEQFDRDKE